MGRHGYGEDGINRQDKSISGIGGRGGAPQFTAYVPKFLRELGGSSAPEGSIAGRKRSQQAKFGPVDQEEESEEERDYDGLASKIQQDGGSIVLPEELGRNARTIKRTKRAGDKEAAVTEEKKDEGKAKEEEEEEKIEYDEHGNPKIKFKKREKEAKPPTKSKGKGVKNVKLLSFDDEEGE
ncbi:hypothetical protein GUITHDRAFT_144425 [Guillardia theta CCMP2712]|uniref:DUF4604 domain-containing protein n=2 Tax=Guillardia theta TaxID=55529 RepID=L1IQL0_GUITC|nr:hypothetical protein GUITHDRAFT_144425 [Guillardia theta CCMP2712]EKX38110.1 hypothetical protein GUITHDRAFT_144425 [Guillardia theta CCMP2712]|eukprot:XP_005825090.1 hypothetical protein GUITHDRAFT_144425 [Guillardia theta CCMP2712]